MSDYVRTFDPSEGKGGSRIEGNIKQAYDRLMARGKEEKAEELRQTEPVSKQNLKAKNIRDFDPVHDRPYNRSRIIIKEVYEALQEADRTEEAEELRFMDSIHTQKEKAIEIKSELRDEEPGPYNRDGL